MLESIEGEQQSISGRWSAEGLGVASSNIRKERQNESCSKTDLINSVYQKEMTDVCKRGGRRFAKTQEAHYQWPPSQLHD